MESNNKGSQRNGLSSTGHEMKLQWVISKDGLVSNRAVSSFNRLSVSHVRNKRLTFKCPVRASIFIIIICHSATVITSRGGQDQAAVKSATH